MFQIILGNKTTLSENKKIITEINFSKKIFFNFYIIDKGYLVLDALKKSWAITGDHILNILIYFLKIALLYY